MIPDLPKPISDFVEANARLDADGMLSVFTADATVRDNDEQYQGRAELKAWLEQHTIAAKAILTPETVSHVDGEVVVGGPVHGDFKGSPIRFTLRFTLENDAVRALVITA